MKKLFFLILILGCTDRTALLEDSSYNEVGNGGDFVRVLMEEGRLHVATILRRLREDALTVDIRQSLQPGEAEWLIASFKAIEEDLRLSRHVWVDTLPKACQCETCGCAISEKTVFFAQTKCEQQITTKLQAAKLALHETLHHFVGNDETKAKRLGAAIFAAWGAMGHPETPHWKVFSNPEAWFEKSTCHSVWTGDELMVWDATKTYFFNPHTEKWRSALNRHGFHLENFSRTSYRGEAFYPKSFWLEGKAYYVHDVNLVGSSFDPKTNNWDALPPPPFPTTWGLELLQGKNELFVWSEGKGAKFDPKTGWRALSLEGAPEPRQTPVSAWAGDRLFLWGGVNPKTYVPLATGASYVVSSNRWEETAMVGAPSPRFDATAVWTGKEMIVTGGYGWDSSPVYEKSGAAFDPKANRWRRIQDNPFTYSSSAEGFSLWTGTVILNFSNHRIVAYNPFLDEWQTMGREGEYPRLLRASAPAWTGMEALFWDCASEMGFAFYP